MAARVGCELVPNSGPALIVDQGRLLTGVELTLVRDLAGVNWVREQCVPGEAAIEHQYIIGSTLPFSNQPSSRLQLGTRTYPHLLAPVELLSKLTELTLPLRAQAAKSDLLHPDATACSSSSRLRYGDASAL